MSNRIVAAGNLLILLTFSTLVTGQEVAIGTQQHGDPGMSSPIVKAGVIGNLPSSFVQDQVPGIQVKPVTWASANSRHRRLYFEEKHLERHGVHRSEFKTNVKSAGRFFSRAIAWPVTLRLLRPNDLQSPYRMGRPGSH